MALRVTKSGHHSVIVVCRINPPLPFPLQDREPASNAACLTKFAELLVLNGLITTEQMWGAFNLVGEMYQTPGGRPAWKQEAWSVNPRRPSAPEREPRCRGVMWPAGEQGSWGCQVIPATGEWLQLGSTQLPSLGFIATKC